MSDFPGDDLSGIRRGAFRNVILSCMAMAAGLGILSSPALPSSGILFGVGVVLGGGGTLAGLVYFLNWLHVCIWTKEAERSFKAKQAEWMIHSGQAPADVSTTGPLCLGPTRTMSDDEIRARVRKDLRRE